MARADLGAVAAISAAVHDRYGEPEAVYAERLALWPSGCFVWEQDGQIAGLLVAHPWYRDSAPALGAMLGVIPENADSFYLHDIALLPQTRGKGAGGDAVTLVVDAARAAGFDAVTLIAVNGADSYWAAQGFTAIDGETGYGPGTVRMRRVVG